MVKRKKASGLMFVIGVFALIGLLNMIQILVHDVVERQILVKEHEQAVEARSNRLLSHSSMLRPASSAVVPGKFNQTSQSRKIAVWRPQPSYSTNTSTQQQQQEQYAGNDVIFTMRNGTKITFPAHVTTFYSNRRYDRAGAALQDYLMAHAFSFHFQRKYGGACGPNYMNKNHLAQMDMIQNLFGLQEELPILNKCPTTNDASAMVLDKWTYYRWKDTDIWTPEWINFLQQKRKREHESPSQQQQQQQDIDDDGPSMVVHIRRGDVSPCDNFTYDRYLPNSHYISLINQYRTADHRRVIVHSEPESLVEDWSNFQAIEGLELKLGGDPVETWRDILNADIYIMSMSSFSLVPALFTKASKVIYTPFWHRPRPNWEIVYNKTLRRETRAEVAMLRATKCTEIFDSMQAYNSRSV